LTDRVERKIIRPIDLSLLEQMKGEIVLEVFLGVEELLLCGNIVDNGWIENLRYSNGSPNFSAIMILSEIIYWYKPTKIKSKTIEDVWEYKKKFKADKLQKSYDALGKRFGLTKRQVKAACDFLKNLGLITIEFRVIQVEGQNIPNVMFIEPVLENIKKITGRPNVKAPTIERNIPLRSNVGATTAERKTNTKTTTEITKKEPPPTSSIISQVKSEAEAFFIPDEKQNELIDIKSKRQKNQTVVATVPYNEIVASYHEHCPSLPRVLKITDARKKQIAARWKDNKENITVFADFFQRIEKSDFLTNKSNTNRNGWICTMDWILNDQNMTKILEGRYDNKIAVPVQTQKEPQYIGWGPNIPDYVRQIAEESARRREG